MKNFLSLLAAVALLFGATTPPAHAAVDVTYTLTQTNASAGATNYTGSIDFGVTNPPVVWKMAYMLAEIPALTNNLVATTNMVYVLQDSALGSTFTDTSPVIELRVWGVASTGSTAKSVKIPLPPDVKRYVRFRQSAGAYDPGTTVSTNKYSLVLP